jgi:hypothetical protein
MLIFMDKKNTPNSGSITLRDPRVMSSGSDPSLLRFIELNRENSNALIEVMLKYDEMSTLLTEAGHDSSELKLTIRSALQSTVVLVAEVNKILQE